MGSFGILEMPPTAYKHARDYKLPLDVNKCGNVYVFTVPGVPYRMYSHFTPSVPTLGYGSTVTLISRGTYFNTIFSNTI